MGDTNASQQQSNQQQANQLNQVGWQQQYPGYYNYGAVPGQPYSQ